MATARARSARPDTRVHVVAQGERQEIDRALDVLFDARAGAAEPR